eukprot:3875399-Prymnesium_polylepis.1
MKFQVRLPIKGKNKVPGTKGSTLKRLRLCQEYGGVAGDVTYFLVEHLLLQRGRMASAALSDF